MGITDELREYASTRITPNKGQLEAIADRIDAEHEKAMGGAGQLLAVAERDRDYNYANWQECKQRVLQHSITIDELYSKIERLEDAHRVELPKDADGEYIHVGDMMERGKARGHVIALMLSEYPKKWGGGLHWGVQLEGEKAPTALDAFFKHYHEPTVEDVLREFGDWYMHVKGGCDEDGIIAEYATKLRLADDGGEQ